MITTDAYRVYRVGDRGAMVSNVPTGMSADVALLTAAKQKMLYAAVPLEYELAAEEAEENGDQYTHVVRVYAPDGRGPRSTRLYDTWRVAAGLPWSAQ